MNKNLEIYNNENKKLANVYLKLYSDCLKYKELNNKKNIDCEKYYNNYISVSSRFNNTSNN